MNFRIAAVGARRPLPSNLLFRMEDLALPDLPPPRAREPLTNFSWLSERTSRNSKGQCGLKQRGPITAPRH